MGSRIAAHFANAGVAALLLDVVEPGRPDPNHAARAGMEAAAGGKTPAFFGETARRRVALGNFEHDLGAVQRCDWIIEAVTERLEVKRALLEGVALWRRPGTIVSTNTSGIPLSRIAEGFSPEFRRHFLGTHFFNPPRTQHLLELIPGPGTAGEVIEFVSAFAETRLGKGVIRAKDTPNFIANRIGAFFGGTVARLAVESGFSIEEVDALTGPLIGLPRSASFRLLDLIGLDVWSRLTENLYDLAPDDPWRERFRTPDFLRRLIERGALGDKTGQGFYRRSGPRKELEALDWRTLDYHPAARPEFPELARAAAIEDLPARLRALVNAGGRAGTFLWSLLRDVLLYSAGRVPEISDRVVEIDRAMRWGYTHRLGPFELWDALGVRPVVARMREEGCRLPDHVERMLASGAVSFYRAADAGGRPRTEYFDLDSGGYATLEDRPGVLVLADIKRARGVVRRNAGASLIDLNGGVLCLEFEDRENTIGEDQVEMLCTAVEETARNYTALVVTSHGVHFSTGSQLAAILRAARAGQWDEIDAALRRFEQANLAVKYSARPVVVAPFGSTLGAGSTLALHAARIQAAAEVSMGFGETAAGLIPASGGCKEALLRLGDPQRAFALIAFGRTTTSAAEARELGMLRAADAISMNPERLLADAKTLALTLAPNYVPRAPDIDIPVGGEAAFAALKLEAWTACQAHRISADDLHVAERLAHVLSGGRLTAGQRVSETYLLDLERETVMSLCGEPRTQHRMEKLLGGGRAEAKK
jgi:3-hydroxyacyl-CoA dehydrogenase